MSAKDGKTSSKESLDDKVETEPVIFCQNNEQPYSFHSYDAYLCLCPDYCSKKTKYKGELAEERLDCCSLRKD